jgi:ABC-type transport system substrate-binding protein
MMPSANVALAAFTGLAMALAACAPAQPAPSAGQRQGAPAPAAEAPPAAPGAGGDLASCPARSAVLRIGGLFGNEAFSSHPMENRFTSTFFSRLHQLPLFGADPLETKLDPAYGAAEAWEFLDDARALKVTLHSGLTFNNGEPVTAEDAAFSVELAASDFADPQLNGVMRAFGPRAEVQGDRELVIYFL